MLMFNGPSGEPRKPPELEMSVAKSLGTVLLNGQVSSCTVCGLMKGYCLH